MQAEPIHDIYTVSHLNTAVRTLLEGHLTNVWVEGEISNFAAPNSGHWYFSLKDTNAQVRCAMFRGNQRRLVCCPKDGMHVLIKARVSLYENRGEYQLIVESIEERGEGKLRLAFEALKKKLEGLGWFDPTRKKPLPLYPRTIGIITSPTGAAIRDILNVLSRRYPCTSVIIYPTLVQGETAAPMIAKAIQTANERKECDVLILARGGGSLEDLWSFNEESVAHAIFQSSLPIISGIGHETDFTIADFVSDRRAPTPSAAAEIATPDQAELSQHLLRHEKQIGRKIFHLLSLLQQKLEWMNKNLHLKDPKRLLREKMQQIDFCEQTLIKCQTVLLKQLNDKLVIQENRLTAISPIHYLQMLTTQLNNLEINLLMQYKNFIQKKRTLFQLAGNQLHALSPLATLDRGYAIVMDKKNKIIQEDHLQPKDQINIRLKNHFLNCIIKNIEKVEKI